MSDNKVFPDAPKTPAEIAAARLDEIANVTFSRNMSLYRDAVKTFWATPDLTPQEICDVWGTSAVARVQAMGILRTTLNTIKPSSTDAIDGELMGTITPNADGTVTATPKA